MHYKPKITMVADAQALTEKAVELFAGRVREVCKSKDSFRVAVSGGRTPRRFFELLAEKTSAEDIPWTRCHMFWVDERFVPSTSDASNYKLVKEHLLDRISIPYENVYPVPTEEGNAQGAARAYEHTIRQAFALGQDTVPQFDFIMLGMGSDGHTASLFPGTLQSPGIDGLVCAIEAADYPRITLTPSVIRAASFIVVLISGKDKAQTLKTVLTREPDEMNLPIQLLWPVLDKVEWLIDRDASLHL